MVQINWTDRALTDLSSIREYISQDSPKYAKLTIDTFISEADKLQTFPSIGRVVPEAGNNSIREIIIGNYRFIYKIISDIQIDILTIHHSARLLHQL